MLRARAMCKVIARVVTSAVLVLPAVAAGEGAAEIRPALLVIDVQNEWLPRMADEDRDSALSNINEAIDLFRELGYPVIRVYHSHPERGPEEGTEQFEFPATVVISESDAKIVKSRPSSFTGTELERVLRDGDRTTVFLCGLSATGCVLATYFGALDRDFMAMMVKDALLSHNASYTDVIEDICFSMTVDQIREALAGAQE